MSESSVKCNNCGQKTTGDHCEWCGYPLTRHGAPGRKYYLILALLLALVLTGVGYAYTYTTASGTSVAESEGELVNCEPVPYLQALRPPPVGWPGKDGSAGEPRSALVTRGLITL